jgi:hypothetical protein
MRLPKNSLKPWLQELFRLASYFEDRSRIDPPIHLVAGGPPSFSPDHNDSVRPDALAHSRWLDLAILAENNRVNSESVEWEGGECDLVWGPGGSRVVVLRSLENDYVRYSAFDLRTGELLCQDIKPRLERPREHSSKVVEGTARAHAGPWLARSYRQNGIPPTKAAARGTHPLRSSCASGAGAKLCERRFSCALTPSAAAVALSVAVRASTARATPKSPR